MGQALTSVKWYNYGKQHFTRNGYDAASKYFKPGSLDQNLDGKVYLVTGANSGIGFQVSKFLSGQGARVYMVCRNAARGEVCAREWLCVCVCV